MIRAAFSVLAKIMQCVEIVDNYNSKAFWGNDYERKHDLHFD